MDTGRTHSYAMARASTVAGMGERTTVIDRVEVYGYDLTYAHGDYVMSSGRVVNVLPSTVVRISTRSGVAGFGETCPLGTNVPARLRRGCPGRACVSSPRH